MSEIVVPICAADDAEWAATQAIAQYRADGARVHLLNVQHPLPKHVAQFFSRDDLHDFHREAGLRALAPAIRMLDEAGVPHEDHVLVGHPAETIVRFADEHRCRDVIVATPQKSVLSMLGLGSIGSQVQHLMRTRAEAATGGASSIM